MLSRISRPIVITLIVACALFMENLDGTIITTAIPAMAESFGETPARLSLGVTAYLISLAVFIPISGWVADRFGARTIFRAAIFVFTLGSVLCGFCNGLMELTGARILQGIGGAMMVPVGRLVMLRSVPKSDLVRAMAYLTMPALIGPILGPPVGGFITTYASWRWIFFLNLPIGLLGMFLVTRVIENHREEETPPLDWVGFLLTGAALTGLVFDCDVIARPGANGLWALGLLAGSLGIGAVAIRHARRHPHSLIDLSLLRIPTFGLTIWSGAVFRMGTGSVNFLLPIMLQVGFGMSAFLSGLLTFASAMGSLSMKMAARPILRRYGFRRVLVVNGAISAVSVLVCALFTESTPVLVIFLILAAGGFFRSLVYTSLNTVAYADISTPKMSAASSFASMMQQLSSGMGVAVGALVLHLESVLRGTSTLGTIDYQGAFVVVGLITLASVAGFLRLAPDAGSEISGHPRKAAAVQAKGPAPAGE